MLQIVFERAVLTNQCIFMNNLLANNEYIFFIHI